METKPELKTAFSNLTPWRQREYLLYFSKAKI
ncbi:YdeI/OmpD-associated family protein [Wenyingzhuangia fucanilytica]